MKRLAKRAVLLAGFAAASASAEAQMSYPAEAWWDNRWYVAPYAQFDVFRYGTPGKGRRRLRSRSRQGLCTELGHRTARGVRRASQAGGAGQLAQLDW